MAHILIIDDEKEVGTFLKYLLEERGHEVTVGYNGVDFEKLSTTHPYQLAMLDVKLPDTNGLELLKKIKSNMPTCKTIIMTGYSTVKTAIEAIRLGASDYIEKPFADIEEIELVIDHLLQEEMTNAENEILELAQMSGIIFGKEQNLRQLLTLSYKIATKNINVLIQGETGTGKELLAHFIHLASNRRDEAYIRINCGALSETMLESELFGHEKGAFTGAVNDRRGIFEIASKGTLFLDEIGEASQATQVKLLRVLETGDFMRVGSEQIRKTNTRVVSATNVDLREAVKQKRFREDLLYRLDVVSLQIPALRERKKDIMTIAEHMVHKIDPSVSVHEEITPILENYEWPGNVRELSNVLKRAISIMDEGENNITIPHLPKQLMEDEADRGVASNALQKDALEESAQEEASIVDYIDHWQKEIREILEQDDIMPLEKILGTIKQLEEAVGTAYIEKALQYTIGNRKEAAELLGITDRRLRYLLKEKGKQ